MPYRTQCMEGTGIGSGAKGETMKRRRLNRAVGILFGSLVVGASLVAAFWPTRWAAPEVMSVVLSLALLLGEIVLLHALRAGRRRSHARRRAPTV